MVFTCHTVLGRCFVEHTTTSFDLGSIFNCTTVTPFGIFDYPSLTNCNRNMGNIKEPIRIYETTLCKYSPTATKFYINHC